MIACLLCGVFLKGGLGALETVPRLPPPWTYRLYDINRTANPYGALELGYEWGDENLRADLFLRHQSSIPAGDHGQNGVWVSMSWFPFRH